MKNITKISVGVDVSKSWLDVCLHPMNKMMRIDNSERAIKKLGAQLSEYQVEQIVCESSGGYQSLLVKILRQEGFLIWCVPPQRVKGFIMAEGVQTKTDKSDAQMIALFAAKIKPKHQIAAEALSEDEIELKSLGRRRSDLVRMRSNEKKTLNHPEQVNCRESIKAHIAYLDKEIAKIDTQIEAVIGKNKRLQEKSKIINSVLGIGPVTTASLLAEMPELGKLQRGQAGALLGVAPYTRESGIHKGRAYIRHGRKNPRDNLYMATLNAARHVPAYREFYERIIAKGKARKVAIVAVMRKLIEVLNVLLRDNVMWAPPSKKTA
jgi:transposase